MKLRFERASRRIDWPLWAIAAGGLWLSLVASAVLLGRITGRDVRLCMFKRLTSVPCPTCGISRAVLALMAGHPVRALLYNPLVFCFIVTIAGLIAVRLAFGRRLVLDLSANQRRLAWVVAIVLLLANWLYVIMAVG